MNKSYCYTKNTVFIDIGNTNIRFYYVINCSIIESHKFTFSTPRNIKRDRIEEVKEFVHDFFQMIKTSSKPKYIIIGFAGVIYDGIINFFHAIFNQYCEADLYLLNDIEWASYMIESDDDFILIKIGTGIGVAVRIGEKIISTELGARELIQDNLNLIEPDYFTFLTTNLQIRQPRYYHILSARGLIYLHWYFSGSNDLITPHKQIWTSVEVEKKVIESLSGDYREEIMILFARFLYNFMKAVTLLYTSKQIMLSGSIIENNRSILELYLHKLWQNQSGNDCLNKAKIRFVSSHITSESFIEFAHNFQA